MFLGLCPIANSGPANEISGPTEYRMVSSRTQAKPLRYMLYFDICAL